MEHDDGDGGTITIPVSLIKAISFEILAAIDYWHEDRGLDTFDAGRIAVAVGAGAQAALDIMFAWPDEGETEH